MDITKFCKELEHEIQAAYESQVTIPEAEKLAAKFLHAQMLLAEKLKRVDLDARMRKSGVKALRAAVYLEEVKKSDKKPSDVMLEAIINSSSMVQSQQDELDAAEVERDELRSFMDIFNNAHIFFRGISKGKFE